MHHRLNKKAVFLFSLSSWHRFRNTVASSNLHLEAKAGYENTAGVMMQARSIAVYILPSSLPSRDSTLAEKPAMSDFEFSLDKSRRTLHSYSDCYNTPSTNKLYTCESLKASSLDHGDHSLNMLGPKCYADRNSLQFGCGSHGRDLIIE